MVSDTAITERQLADIRAEEYRARGYEVERNVPLEFLPDFKADLVVRKDGHTKVIAVATRTTLARRSSIKELGRVLNNKPGWSFQLLLVGEPERLHSPADSFSMPHANIVRRLAEAQQATDAGLDVAAFLLAWSAAEAAVRALVAVEGVLLDRVTTPDYVLDVAVYHGAISREDYHYLFNLMTYRNALAHGFEAADFDRSLTTDLVETVQRLMLQEPE